MAFEDSPNGVASAAAAAGCRVVVVVPSLLPIPPAPGRMVLSSLLEVNLGMLRELAAYDTIKGAGRRVMGYNNIAWLLLTAGLTSASGHLTPSTRRLG